MSMLRWSLSKLHWFLWFNLGPKVDFRFTPQHSRVEREWQKHQAFRVLNFSIQAVSSTISDFEFQSEQSQEEKWTSLFNIKNSKWSMSDLEQNQAFFEYDRTQPTVKINFWENIQLIWKPLYTILRKLWKLLIFIFYNKKVQKNFYFSWSCFDFKHWLSIQAISSLKFSIFSRSEGKSSKSFRAFSISILVKRVNFWAIRAKFRAILCLVSILTTTLDLSELG